VLLKDLLTYLLSNLAIHQ